MQGVVVRRLLQESVADRPRRRHDPDGGHHQITRRVLEHAVAGEEAGGVEDAEPGEGEPGEGWIGEFLSKNG